MNILALAAGSAAAFPLAFAALPVADAQPAPHDASRCFHLDDVESFRLANPRVLYMRLGDGRVYRLGFGADCDNLGTQPLSLHPFDNSGIVCGYIDLNVSVTGVGEECIPTSLAELTSDEAAAIPPKDRP
jgi:hypothetical protein